MRSDLNIFLLEVQTLEIGFFPNPQTNVPMLDLSSYSQGASHYDQKIIQLRQLALSEILLLSKDQIQLQTNKLKYINDKFDRFWKFYFESFLKFGSGELPLDLYLLKLGSYINVYFAKTDVSFEGYKTSFKGNLHDAIMFKHNEVGYLLHEIKTIVNIEPVSYITEGEYIGQEPAKRGRESSYQFLDDDLTTFYDALRDKYLVDSSLTDFLAVFSKNPISTIKPLRWKSGNASELLYFLKALMDKGLIAKEDRMNYQRLKGCFVKSDGQPFNESLKDLKLKLEVDFSQVKKEEIENLLCRFL